MDELLTFQREYCIFVKIYNFDFKKKERKKLDKLSFKKDLSFYVKWLFNFKKKKLGIIVLIFPIKGSDIKSLNDLSRFIFHQSFELAFSPDHLNISSVYFRLNLVLHLLPLTSSFYI